MLHTYPSKTSSRTSNAISDHELTDGRSYCKTVGRRPRIFGVKGRIDDEEELVESIPKRRITSEIVTMMDTAIRMIIIHVWPVGVKEKKLIKKDEQEFLNLLGTTERLRPLKRLRMNTYVTSGYRLSNRRGFRSDRERLDNARSTLGSGV